MQIYNNENVDLKSVSRLAFPMMLSMLGWTLTFTINRIIIARYDLSLMNALFAVGTIAFIFEHFLSTIAVTSEIFTGQYNGSKNYEKAPVAAWQMIFLSILTIPAYLFIALFLGKYLIPSEYYEIAKNYFGLIVSFMWLSGFKESLQGFFVGIKKTNLIFAVSIVGNLISIILTYLLVFGVEEYIPSMGLIGLAIATITKFIVEASMLFLIFISEKFNRIYNTRTAYYHSIIFFRALKLGFPNAIGLVAEIGGSFAVQFILIKLLNDFVTEYNIVLNSFILILFITIGTQKAVTAIASNLIGGADLTKFDNLISSSIKFLSIILGIITVIFIFFGNHFTMFYTSNPEEIAHIYNLMFLMLLCTFFDGIGLIYSGITLSGGDTRYTMMVNITAVWMFKVIPTYLLIKFGFREYYIAWLINVLTTIVYMIFMYYRYKSKKWLKMQL